MRRYQFVWWGWSEVIWPWVAFKRLDPKETDLARIYSWSLWLGPLEIRRWTQFSIDSLAEAKDRK